MLPGRLAAIALAVLASCCSTAHGDGTNSVIIAEAQRALDSVQRQYAPNRHLAIFNVGVTGDGRGLVLTGEVDNAEARLEAARAVAATGASVTNRISVLPSATLGDKTWGIACLSVASGRVQPDHKTEMGTQILMGNVVKVWKQATNWFLVQSADGYLTWLEKGTFVRRARTGIDAWNAGPLLVVTTLEDCVLEHPEADSQSVSDVVIGDILEMTDDHGEWFRVELPDGRAGYLPKRAAASFADWKAARRATADGLEQTARRFLGRPYLWGGASPKGLDCSGLTKLVFFLNGMDLNRDASEQARQGREIPLDADLSQLRKGDLLFFGRRASPDRPERIVHVGMYLGDRMFIQSSERVQISSLDPESPIRDEHRIRTLLHARRILPEP